MNTDNKKTEKQFAIHGVISRLSMQEVLNYEIHSHWLASWIGFEWGQDLMGKYFAWKVRRKYNRYLVSLEERKRVLNGLQRAARLSSVSSMGGTTMVRN